MVGVSNSASASRSAFCRASALIVCSPSSLLGVGRGKRKTGAFQRGAQRPSLRVIERYQRRAYRAPFRIMETLGQHALEAGKERLLERDLDECGDPLLVVRGPRRAQPAAHRV